MSRIAIPRIATLIALFLALTAGSPLAAQEKVQKRVEIKYVIPEKLERPTKADDKGMLLWAPHDKQKCPTCSGTTTTGCAHCDRIEGNTKCLECSLKKTAPCRTCGGLGYLPDPLEKVSCPGCLGATVVECDVCNTIGSQKVTGSGDKPKECLACKGDGGFKCTVCKGARLVEPAQLKPSLAEAGPEALKKALEATDATLKALAAFEPTGKGTRKEIKKYLEVLGTGAAFYPPLKRCQVVAEEVMKSVLKGEVWQGHEEREAAELKRMKASNEYYLKVNKRMIELAIARAEANAKLAAEKKSK